mmetsp:Transcript_57358/g.124633  ORF Transcript_57358/g.124633 Transcript_57358/m.124633 type:complete len:228 (-) Transcript_57358:782-1465(-)
MNEQKSGACSHPPPGAPISLATSHCSLSSSTRKSLRNSSKRSQKTPLAGILCSSRGTTPLPKAVTPSSRHIALTSASTLEACFAVMTRVLTTSIGLVAMVATAPAAAPQSAPSHGGGSLPSSARRVCRLRDSYVSSITTPKGRSRASCARCASGGNIPPTPLPKRSPIASLTLEYRPAWSLCLTISHGTRSVAPTVLAMAAEMATSSSGGAFTRASSVPFKLEYTAK